MPFRKFTAKRRHGRGTRKNRLGSSASTVAWARKRKDARSQSGQIIKTNKTINRLNNRVKNLSSHVKQGLYLNLYDRIGGLSTSQPSMYIAPLCPAQVASTGTGTIFSAWDTCFSGDGASAPNVDQCSLLKIGNIHCKLKIVADTEPTPCNITVVVFRVKEEACPNVFQDAGEDLTGLDVASTKNVIYGVPGALTTSASQLGVVTMNPAFFNVLYQKRLVIGSDVWDAQATPITNQRDVCKDYSFSIPCNYNFGQAGRGTASDLNGMDGTPRARRTYIAIFSDNSSLDTQYPSFALNSWCYAHGKL